MTRWFNGGTLPLVPEGRWGDGVIMPGESYVTDQELPPPWTQDAEAEAALNPEPTSGDLPTHGPQAGNTSDTATDGHSMAQNAPQTPNEPSPEQHDDPAQARDETVRVEPNGDVVNQAGVVIGHVDQP